MPPIRIIIFLKIILLCIRSFLLENRKHVGYLFYLKIKLNQYLFRRRDYYLNRFLCQQIMAIKNSNVQYPIIQHHTLFHSNLFNPIQLYSIRVCTIRCNQFYSNITNLNRISSHIVQFNRKQQLLHFYRIVFNRCCHIYHQLLFRQLYSK